MTTVKSFEDLEVWQLARQLCNAVFPLTEKEKFKRDFELKDQINASSGSVMDNIAEGFERDGTKEFRQALSIAKGSCGEVRSQSYRALDRGYITKEEQELLFRLSKDLGKKLGNFIAYLNNTEYKGNKFKEN